MYCMNTCRSSAAYWNINSNYIYLLLHYQRSTMTTPKTFKGGTTHEDDEDSDAKIPAVSTPTKAASIGEADILRCSPRLNNGRQQRTLTAREKLHCNNGKLLLVPKMVFDTFEKLKHHVDSFALQNGFIASMSNNY